MEIAFCTLDKVKYAIQVFDRLSREEIQIKRRHLECVFCSGPAYYRRLSSDGKKPCFGAHHKRADCEGKSQTDREKEADDGKAVRQKVERILASREEFTVDFEGLFKKKKASASGLDAAERRRAISDRIGKSHVKNPPKSRVPSYTLRSLLAYARSSENFALSDVTCHVDGYPRKVSELFVRLDDTVPSERPHFYWGVIQDADMALKWLNTGGQDRVSILISKCRARLTRRFRIEDKESCPGRYVIVFGWCNESKQGKKYIEVKDPSRIYLTAQP